MQFVVRCACLNVLLVVVQSALAEQKVAVRSDIPGGNVVVVKSAGAEVQVAPDLRGGQPWFYWNFEAAAAEPGQVTFSFAGSPLIGVSGPAYSLDEGKSWQWLGAEHCTFATAGSGKERRETFTFEFRPERLKARFAVAVPYLPANLQEFAAAHTANPHFKQQYLTKSRSGTPVEMFVIGKTGEGRQAMLVTARHHACESMASYVLEGFLDEAMSSGSAGSVFRERYALFAVPLVDRDGVAAGDQGKNRDPHDHNRDYGASPIYPEVAAIQELGEAHDIKYAIDFHCPALRGDIHEAFHFLGLGVPRVKENLDELLNWIKEERPQLVMTPLNYLTDSTKPNAVNPKIFSHHFALREGAVIAATLEVPYTQQSPPLDVDMAREYGRGLLRAWTRTKFLTEGADAARGAAGNAEFTEFRTNARKFYRNKPAEIEAAARAYLTAEASPIYRAEANYLLALIRQYQRKYAEAREFSEAAINDPQAMMSQRIAASITRLQVAADDPAIDSATMDAWLAEFDRLPYPAKDQAFKALEAAAKFHAGGKRYAVAIALKRRQLEAAASHESGRVLIQLADLHDQAQQPDEALKTRQAAVALLRERLGPAPKRNVFAAMMTVDLFDALCGIPVATLEEKRAAAQMVFDHEIVAAAYKDRVRKQLAELEKGAK